MLRWLARVLGLLLVAAGIGVAVLPFRADAVVRDDPLVEVTTDCPAPVGEAFTPRADSAYFLAGQDEPVVSPNFGCGSPSRKRVAVGAAGVLIGGAVLIAVGGRRRTGIPVPDPKAKPPVRSGSLLEPPPPPPPLGTTPLLVYPDILAPGVVGPTTPAGPDALQGAAPSDPWWDVPAESLRPPRASTDDPTVVAELPGATGATALPDASEPVGDTAEPVVAPPVRLRARVVAGSAVAAVAQSPTPTAPTAADLAWRAPHAVPSFAPAPRVDDVPPPVGSLEELELIRARQVIRRHLPAAPAKVVEVGTPVHAGWLADDGYRVQAASPNEAGYLDLPNAGLDVAIVVGPLTTRPERDERIALLQEARRVVKPGGIVAVGATNRFAALFAGLAQGQLFDPGQRDAIGSTLADGVRGRNHLHHPDELRQELDDAGLDVVELVGLEGLAGWLPQLTSQWGSMDGRRVIVEAVQGIESEETLLGLSAHLLAISRRR